MNKYKKLESIIREHEDEFMEAVIGSSTDEWNNRYAREYKCEWGNAIDNFVNYTYKNFLEIVLGEKLSVDIMATLMGLEAACFCIIEDGFDYMKVTEWCQKVVHEYNEWLEVQGER